MSINARGAYAHVIPLSFEAKYTSIQHSRESIMNAVISDLILLT